MINKEKQYKLMNWYYRNTTKIFRYTLGILTVLFFIFLMYIVIPTDTKNGVSDDYSFDSGKKQASSVNNMNVINQFVITSISSKHSEQQARSYTNNIVKFIDAHPNQEIYKTTFHFLLEICKKPKNKNTEILFSTLKTKMMSEEFKTKLNGENTVLRTNLEMCYEEKSIETVTKNPNLTDDDVLLSELQKRKVVLENQIQLMNRKREFDKEARGQYYNAQTGRTRYQEKNINDKYQEETDVAQYESLVAALEQTNEKINRIQKERQQLQREQEQSKQIQQ